MEYIDCLEFMAWPDSTHSRTNYLFSICFICSDKVLYIASTKRFKRNFSTLLPTIEYFLPLDGHTPFKAASIEFPNMGICEGFNSTLFWQDSKVEKKQFDICLHK